jgi:hypothetical protein
VAPEVRAIAATAPHPRRPCGAVLRRFICGPWATPIKILQTAPNSGRIVLPGRKGILMDIVERFYIAAAALSFFLIAAMALLS